MKKQAITFGRVGVLLPVAAIIPFLGILAGLASLILILISHYYFSKAYETPTIFKNALNGAIIAIAANIAGGILIAIAIGTTAVSFWGNDMNNMGIQQITDILFSSGFAIFGFVVILGGAIIGYYFVYKAMKELAVQSKIHFFRIAGLLYFVGAITSIILIGGIVIFIGWILHIIAYFSTEIEETVETT